eukprot:UN05428
MATAVNPSTFDFSCIFKPCFFSRDKNVIAFVYTGMLLASSTNGHVRSFCK